MPTERENRTSGNGNERTENRVAGLRFGQWRIRSLIAAVALLGLNFAGAITTSRHFPRETIEPHELHSVRSRVETDADGTITIRASDNPLGGGSAPHWRVVRVYKRPSPPNLLEVWSPVIFSLSLTILVVLVPWRKHAASEVATDSSRRRSLQLVRRLAIVSALVILNIAAIAYREPARPNDPWFRNYRMPEDLRAAVYGRHPDDYSVSLYGTIAFRLDGSIVGYEGDPGKEHSQPYVFRPATHGVLEAWWPVAISLTLTAAISVVTVRRLISRESLTLTPSASDPSAS